MWGARSRFKRVWWSCWTQSSLVFHFASSITIITSVVYIFTLKSFCLLFDGIFNRAAPTRYRSTRHHSTPRWGPAQWPEPSSAARPGRERALLWQCSRSWRSRPRPRLHVSHPGAVEVWSMTEVLLLSKCKILPTVQIFLVYWRKLSNNYSLIWSSSIVKFRTTFIKIGFLMAKLRRNLKLFFREI